jgi:hypothetical protein
MDSEDVQAQSERKSPSVGAVWQDTGLLCQDELRAENTPRPSCSCKDHPNSKEQYMRTKELH